MKNNTLPRLICIPLVILILIALVGCAETGNKPSHGISAKSEAKTEAAVTEAEAATKETKAKETEATETETETETNMPCDVAFAGQWSEANVQCVIYMLLLNSDGKVKGTISNDQIGNGTENRAISGSFGFRHNDNNLDIKINAYKTDNYVLVEYIHGVAAVGPNPPRFEGTYSVYDISQENGIDLIYQMSLIHEQGKDMIYCRTEDWNNKFYETADDFYGYFASMGVTFSEVTFNVGLPGPQMVCDYEKILDLNSMDAQEPADPESVIASLGLAQ